jgi:hypothetical protein
MPELEAVKAILDYVHRMAEERGDTSPYFAYDTNSGEYSFCDWGFYDVGMYDFADPFWESSNVDPVALWNDLQKAITDRTAEMAEQDKENEDDDAD